MFYKNFINHHKKLKNIFEKHPFSIANKKRVLYVYSSEKKDRSLIF